MVNKSYSKLNKALSAKRRYYEQLSKESDSTEALKILQDAERLNKRLLSIDGSI